MNDPWQWTAVLLNGSRVAESDVGTLRAIPALMIKQLHLRHPGGGHVWVNKLSGEGWINGIRMPAPLLLGSTDRVPMFFRRRNGFLDGSVKTEFRAIGFMLLPGPQFAALRVWDDRVDMEWCTAWAPETAAHTASQTLLIEGINV